MANPLLEKMSNNIVGQKLQNNPIMNLLNIVRGGNFNQKQLISMVSNQNPQLAQNLEQMMNSGKSPQEVLNGMMANRSPLEIENFKNTLGQMGFPQDTLNNMFGNNNQGK